MLRGFKNNTPHSIIINNIRRCSTMDRKIVNRELLLKGETVLWRCACPTI